jgi:hypothetical protein
MAETSTQPESPKDAALRAVGRTVVNFQRLEHNLKLAAQLGRIQGTLERLQTNAGKRRERAQSLTLGQAIQAWLSYLGGDSTPAAWTPDLFDISVQVTFSLEADGAGPDAHAETLRSLLETRNALVHGRLATFPWASEDACAQLVVELDTVNASLAEQIEYVAALVGEIQRAHREVADGVVAAIEAAQTRQGGGDTMPDPSSERR